MATPSLISLNRVHVSQRTSREVPSPTNVVVQMTRGAVAAGLIGLVTVTPWAFGAIEPVIQTWIAWAVAFLGAIAAVSWTLGGRPVSLPVLVIPVTLGILLGLTQVLPLPREFLARIAPMAADLWSTEGLPLEAADRTPLATISLAPASTRADLARLCLALVVLVLGSQFLSSVRAQVWLWGAILLNGAALSLFGIVQHLTWNGKLYWTIAPTFLTTAFGPYVNHNNAAGWLLICLGGAFPFLVGRRSGGVARSLASVAAVTIVAGIAVSLSRGAMLAAVGAGVVVFVSSLKFGVRPLIGMGAVVVAAAGAIYGAGLSHSVQSRLATLDSQELQQNARLVHWRETAEIIPRTLWTGTGLGTYRAVNPLFQSRTDEETFHHAENQYLEAIVESGVFGLSFVLLAIGVFFAASVKLLRQGGDAVGVGLAALYVLASQSLHAVVDFGLYLPANTLLLALIGGAIAGRAGLVLPRSGFGIALPNLNDRITAVAFAVCLMVLSAFSVWELQSTEETESLRSALREATTQRGQDFASREAALKSFGVSAASISDAPLHKDLAHAWIDLYSDRTADRIRSQRDEASPGDESLREWSSTTRLHDTLVELERRGSWQSADAFRFDPLVTTTLHPAVEHLMASRLASPLSPWVQFRLGELATLFPLTDSAHVLDGFEEAITRRSDLCYHLGRLHFMAGRTDRALRVWCANPELSERFSKEIADLVTRSGRQHEAIDTVERSLKDDPSNPSLARLGRSIHGLAQDPE